MKDSNPSRDQTGPSGFQKVCVWGDTHSQVLLHVASSSFPMPNTVQEGACGRDSAPESQSLQEYTKQIWAWPKSCFGVGRNTVTLLTARDRN